MSNKEKRIEILTKDELRQTISRLTSEIIENVSDIKRLLLLGIPTRGVHISKVLVREIKINFGIDIESGVIDPTLYRDDQKRIETRSIKATQIPDQLENKEIILVDDVIYTGRTIRAAIEAIHIWGRPKKIMLLAMVDRGHRELPIQPDFCGKKIATRKDENIELKLNLVDGEEGVYLIK